MCSQERGLGTNSKAGSARMCMCVCGCLLVLLYVSSPLYLILFVCCYLSPSFPLFSVCLLVWGWMYVCVVRKVFGLFWSLVLRCLVCLWVSLLECKSSVSLFVPLSACLCVCMVRFIRSRQNSHSLVWTMHYSKALFHATRSSHHPLLPTTICAPSLCLSVSMSSVSVLSLVILAAHRVARIAVCKSRHFNILR